MRKKQYIDPVVEEAMRTRREKRKMVENYPITVGYAQQIVKNFFCECIENNIMEIDVVDANAELCRRLEAPEFYISIGGRHGKKIDR